MQNLNELNARMSDLKKHIEAQDLEVYRQQRLIEALQKQVKKQQERIESLEQGGASNYAPADEKPPHY